MSSLRQLPELESHHPCPVFCHVLSLISFSVHSVSVSPYMLARLACRSAMPAGSCTVWSMASSLTGRCPVTRPLEEETTPSTPSSVRLELGSAGHGEYRWPQHKHAHPPGEWPPPGGLHGSHGGPYNRGKVILCQRERYHNQLTNEPFIEELV